jgi:hypothetical protein
MSFHARDYEPLLFPALAVLAALFLVIALILFRRRRQKLAADAAAVEMSGSAATKKNTSRMVGLVGSTPLPTVNLGSGTVDDRQRTGKTLDERAADAEAAEDLWEEYADPSDSTPYYLHVATGSVQWQRPTDDGAIIIVCHSRPHQHV